MENGMDWLFWAVLIIGALAFLYVPQFLAKRRQKKRKEDLSVGDRVMTIGGFIGTLTYLDFEDNVASIELAEGVEVQIVPGAISGKRQRGSSEDESATAVKQSQSRPDNAPDVNTVEDSDTSDDASAT